MKSNKKLFNSLVVLGVLLIIICLDILGVFGMVKMLIVDGTLDMAGSTSYIKDATNRTSKIFFGASDLASDNERLMLENQELLAKEVELDELRLENEHLRQSMAISNIEDEPKQLINIHSNILNGEQGVFFADKGAKDDVKVGQVVINGDGYFIGKIVKAENSWSEGLFASNMPAELPVKIAGKDVQGVVRIESKGWTLDMVPKDTKIAAGDILLLDADQEVLAAGSGDINIIVGRLTEVLSNEKDIFNRGVVIPLINFQDVRQGFILTSE